MINGNEVPRITNLIQDKEALSLEGNLVLDRGITGKYPPQQ